MMREQAEHLQFRALMQVMLDKDKGIEAYDEYRAARFPFLATQKKRDRAQVLSVLEQELKRGVLTVTPLGQKPMNSRLKQRVERKQALQEDPKARDAANALYKKMGQFNV